MPLPERYIKHSGAFPEVAVKVCVWLQFKIGENMNKVRLNIPSDVLPDKTTMEYLATIDISEPIDNREQPKLRSFSLDMLKLIKE